MESRTRDRDGMHGSKPFRVRAGGRSRKLMEGQGPRRSRRSTPLPFREFASRRSEVNRPGQRRKTHSTSYYHVPFIRVCCYLFFFIVFIQIQNRICQDRSDTAQRL